MHDSSQLTIKITLYDSEVLCVAIIDEKLFMVEFRSTAHANFDEKTLYDRIALRKISVSY